MLLNLQHYSCSFLICMCMTICLIKWITSFSILSSGLIWWGGYLTQTCTVLEKQHSENPHACILSIITASELCCKGGVFIFARWGLFYHCRQIKVITSSTEDAVTQFLDNLAVTKTFPGPVILWPKTVAPFGKQQRNFAPVSHLPHFIF